MATAQTPRKKKPLRPLPVKKFKRNEEATLHSLDINEEYIVMFGTVGHLWQHEGIENNRVLTEKISTQNVLHVHHPCIV
jgi:hypothetical protein